MGTSEVPAERERLWNDRSRRNSALRVISRRESPLDQKDTASRVLRTTRGCGDDLYPLYSAMARESDQTLLRSLQVAADALEIPDVEQSLRDLCALIDVPATDAASSDERLFPEPAHLPHLCRWIDKATARWVVVDRPWMFIEAARAVGGALLDQIVLRDSARGLITLHPGEDAAIRGALHTRPSPEVLASRADIRRHASRAGAILDLPAGLPPYRLRRLTMTDMESARMALRGVVLDWLSPLDEIAGGVRVSDGASPSAS